MKLYIHSPKNKENLQKYFDKLTKTKPQFKIGAIARIKTIIKKLFLKGYDVQNNQILFESYNILSSFPLLMHQIEGIDNPKEDVIKGKLCGHELTLTSNE